MLACIVPAVVMVVALIVFYHQQDVARSRVDTIAKAQGFATALNNRMTGVISTLGILASSGLPTGNDFSAFHRRAQDAMGSQQAATITLVNAQGQQLLDTSVPYGTPLPAVVQPQITKLAQNGKAGFVDFFDSGAPGTGQVAVVVPMKLANGSVLLLTATIGPDNLRQLLTTPAFLPR